MEREVPLSWDQWARLELVEEVNLEALVVVDLGKAGEGSIRREHLVAIRLALLLAVLVQEFVDPEDQLELGQLECLEEPLLEEIVIPVVAMVQ